MKKIICYCVSFIFSWCAVKFFYSLHSEKSIYEKYSECDECVQYSREIVEIKKQNVAAQIERRFIDPEDGQKQFYIDGTPFVYMRADISSEKFHFGFDLYGASAATRKIVIHNFNDSVEMNIFNEPGLWGCYGNILECWSGKGPFCKDLIPYDQLIQCKK